MHSASSSPSFPEVSTQSYVQAPAEELGIIISKKRNQNKNTTGFEIAHIDPDGLIHR